MAKEKNYNPVQAQHKADKARALKKSKANVQAQRNERLAKRNPDRLQRQIDDLKAAEERNQLRPKDRETLHNLEKELRAIKKAREALGDKAPQFHSERRRDSGDGGRGGGILGKRRRGGNYDKGDGSDSSDTDDDARDIPMPRDTPPPIPRRPRWTDNQTTHSGPHALPAKPGAPAGQPAEVKTVYESAPVHRDLRKEATSRFMPAAVARKVAAAKGETPGQLLEPEELEKLEKSGYRAVGHQPNQEEKEKIVQSSKEDAEQAAEAAIEEAEFNMMNAAAEAEGDPDLGAEEERFERELKQVELEEVEDEAFAN
ncbi:WW domain binding protein 11-domain-containing protein [Phyllosticta citribraziliensis]|uniref:WW domain binding protein 11-domain-containing protein n=1 Tax=Phyllosticta citribraziliensis TaxID=989973 RepID=A0ABR1LMI3_9PEZI